MSANNDAADTLTPARPDVTDAPSRNRPYNRTRSRDRSSRIALFGLFGCGNLGNDGSLEAMIDFLETVRPDADLLCICDNPGLVAQTHDIATLPISRSRHRDYPSRKLDRLLLKTSGKLFDLAQIFSHVRKIDVMIVPGTGILDDFGERPYGMPLDIFWWCLAARLMGVKIAFVSIGAGPIGHRLSRLLMAGAARLAHYRSYRDILSKDFMDGIGFDTKGDLVYPDIAFRLKTPPTNASKQKATRRTVGVGVMSYYGWYGFADGADAIFERYIGKLAQFVIHLLDSGHDVHLLTGELADKSAVDALLTAIAQRRPNTPDTRLTAQPSSSLHEVMRQISETDVVVATRFHNIVCALKMGRPTISLGYSKKNDVLMAEMGLEAYCQHVETFDVDTLIKQFVRLMAERDTHERVIRGRTSEFAQRLEQQDQRLLSTILAPGGGDALVAQSV